MFLFWELFFNCKEEDIFVFQGYTAHDDNEINSMDTDDNNENSVVTLDYIGVIQDTFDFSVYFSNGSVNNLTLRMRVEFAKK